MKLTEAIFLVSGPDLSGRAALGAFKERFRTRRESRSARKRSYYDTVDWRLYRDGGALAVEARNGGRELLWLARDGDPRQRLVVGQMPDFAWDLEPGAFRDELFRVTGVRRLFPLVHVDLRSETLAVLDRREKTVARVHLEHGTAAAGADPSTPRQLAERLRVTSVVGYQGAHAAVVRRLDEISGLERHAGGELPLALAAIGTEPGSYSSKLDVALDPRMHADEATKMILGALLRTMQANEEGTRRDLDSEFLHDFRVAVRRTRSCLGQVKRVFDAAAIEGFRREFAWLGALTGPTRDLDVYLLNMREYPSELTESLRPGLVALEDYLRKRQNTEQRRVARALGSERYAKLVRNWEAFLDRPPSADHADGPDATRPVRDVAVERIGRAYRRVRKGGRGLEADSPPETVHRLRIDCKKLRYLLEFFRSLFDERRVTSVVRSLKRLQDRLGEFNDLDVQQRELRAMSSEMLGRGAADAETLLAMGCLIGRLEQRQAELKRKLVGHVRAFAGNETRLAVRELLQ